MIHLAYATIPNDYIIASPYSITHHLRNFLSERDEVRFYDMYLKGVADVGSDDVFIGHPAADDEVTMRTLREKQCRLKCAIMPLHVAGTQNVKWFLRAIEIADVVFAICGPYWYDMIDKSALKPHKHKIVRLDMAVDGNDFPYLKRKFNPIGERKLLYIGNKTLPKNVGYLGDIMEAMPDVMLWRYGEFGTDKLSRLPNVKSFGFTEFNHDIMKMIAEECDIFVNPSFADANPTTIIEAMALGLVVTCTRRSGYYNDPLITELPLGDVDAAVEVLRGLLNKPESELMRYSETGRIAIESVYTWDRFCNKIWSYIV